MIQSIHVGDCVAELAVAQVGHVLNIAHKSDDEHHLSQLAMSFEDIEERDGESYGLYSEDFAAYMRTTRCAFVVERLAIISHRGNEDGGAHCSSLLAFEAER